MQHETVSVDLATGANKADWFISKVCHHAVLPLCEQARACLHTGTTAYSRLFAVLM